MQPRQQVRGAQEHGIIWKRREILCWLSIRGRDGRGVGEVVAYKEGGGRGFKDSTPFVDRGPHSVVRRESPEMFSKALRYNKYHI